MFRLQLSKYQRSDKTPFHFITQCLVDTSYGGRTFLFYFIFKLYIIVLVLPNIKMNPPQVYMCSPSWTLLPPPSSLPIPSLWEEHFWIKKNCYKYVARHWYVSYTNPNDAYSKRSISCKINLEKSWLSFYRNYCVVANHVRLLVIPWTAAHQAPLSMGFPRQEYWSGLPFLPPGNEPKSPALAGGFFTNEAPGKPPKDLCNILNNGAERSCSEMELFHHLWNVFDPRALLLCKLPYIWGSPEYSLERKWKWKLLSCVRLFATPWTIQSMELSRPEYWSG